MSVCCARCSFCALTTGPARKRGGPEAPRSNRPRPARRGRGDAGSRAAPSAAPEGRLGVFPHRAPERPIGRDPSPSPFATKWLHRRSAPGPPKIAATSTFPDRGRAPPPPEPSSGRRTKARRWHGSNRGHTFSFPRPASGRAGSAPALLRPSARPFRPNAPRVGLEDPGLSKAVGRARSERRPRRAAPQRAALVRRAGGSKLPSPPPGSSPGRQRPAPRDAASSSISPPRPRRPRWAEDRRRPRRERVAAPIERPGPAAPASSAARTSGRVAASAWPPPRRATPRRDLPTPARAIREHPAPPGAVAVADLGGHGRVRRCPIDRRSPAAPPTGPAPRAPVARS
jgi:hypothetical protein